MLCASPSLPVPLTFRTKGTWFFQWQRAKSRRRENLQGSKHETSSWSSLCPHPIPGERGNKAGTKRRMWWAQDHCQGGKDGNWARDVTAIHKEAAAPQRKRKSSPLASQPLHGAQDFLLYSGGPFFAWCCPAVAKGHLLPKHRVGSCSIPEPAHTGHPGEKSSYEGNVPPRPLPQECWTGSAAPVQEQSCPDLCCGPLPAEERHGSFQCHNVVKYLHQDLHRELLTPGPTSSWMGAG